MGHDSPLMLSDHSKFTSRRWSLNLETVVVIKKIRTTICWLANQHVLPVNGAEAIRELPLSTNRTYAGKASLKFQCMTLLCKGVLGKGLKASFGSSQS